eukprot:7731251-Pyramimonas_sp.AAC.1
MDSLTAQVWTAAGGMAYRFGLPAEDSRRREHSRNAGELWGESAREPRTDARTHCGAAHPVALGPSARTSLRTTPG